MLVLLFHAGYGWMSGGYLGVSVFFTLSGFLITRLLLREHASTGRVSLGRFYARRARRLLPASIVCVVAVMAARMAGAFANVDSLRSDALAAVGQVFNWSRLAGTSSYADLFLAERGGVSPLEHYWSLAIEEQFYLVWPVALLGLVAVAHRRGWSLARVVFVVTGVFALVAGLVAVVFGSDAAYWSTPARLAEILLGCSLAVWCARRANPVPRRWRWWGVPAASAIVVLSVVLPARGGPAYHGLLPVFAVLSAAVIAAVQVAGPLRTLLAWRPLVLIGRISYGVYLFHWPIFVILRERGWDLSAGWSTVVAVAITVAVAMVSYLLIEQPIRHAAWPRARLATLALLGAASVAVVVAVAPAAVPYLDVDEELLASAEIRPVASLTPLRPVATTADPAVSSPSLIPPTTTSATTPVETAPATTDPAPTDATAPATTAPATTAPATTAPATTAPFATTIDLPPPPERPVRILVVGDSTALFLAQGLAAWQADHPDYAQSTVQWSQGAGFILDGTIASFDGSVYVRDSAALLAGLPATIDLLQPDVVALMTTVDDVADRQWDPDEGRLAPTDAAFRRRMLRAYSDLTATILAAGVERVIWVVPPTPTFDWPQPELQDPARWLAHHDVIRQVAGGDPARVGVIDLDRWFDETGAAHDDEIRPDHVHMTIAAATSIAEQFVGPAIIRQVLGE